MKYLKAIAISSILFSLIHIYLGHNEYCTANSEYIDYYEEQEYALDFLVKKGVAREVFGSRQISILEYAEKINNYIMDGNVDGLVSILSKDDFRYYPPLRKKSENLSQKIQKELIERKGVIYYMLFNKTELTKNEEWAYPAAKDVDIKKYLKMYHKKLKWRVLFFPKENVYEAWFSIPDHFVLDFDFFHYRIKEHKGRYILIGF